MPNKKIASEIAFGIIILLAIVIGGIFWFKGEKAQAPEVAPESIANQPMIPEAQPQQTQQQNPQPTADETASWKTYKDEKYGYEIKYPQNWNYKIENGQACFRENGKTYSIEMSDVCAISISDTTNADTERLSIDEWSKQTKQSGSNVTNMNVDSLEAVQAKNYVGTETIISANDSSGLQIDLATPNFGDPASNSSVGEIYNQMLSTFKFTN